MREQFANLLCQNFYKFLDPPADPKQTILVPGQIVSAHTVYPPVDPWIIQVLRYDALDESRSQYRVKRYSPEDRSHMPIAELGLRSDENYYVYIGKERPLIVVRQIRSRWINPLYDETLVACVPVFSFKSRHTEEFRIKSMGFCYPDLFYLPSDPNGCTEESAARFELMQPIARRALHSHMKGSPSRAVALSDAAFALFINHLGRYLIEKNLDEQVCADIDAYQEIILWELAKSGS
jgi:hypothetical protein